MALKALMVIPVLALGISALGTRGLVSMSLGAMALFVPAEPLCRPPQFAMVLELEIKRSWVGVCAIFSTGILVVVSSSVGPLVSMMSRCLLVALSLSSTLTEHLRVLTVMLELFCLRIGTVVVVLWSCCCSLFCL